MKYWLLVFAVLAGLAVTPAKAQSPCATVSSSAPPRLLAVGEELKWGSTFTFTPLPGKTCDLNAELTTNPGYVEMKVLAISTPYHCELPALTDARCTGQGSTIATLDTYIQGRAPGESIALLNVNGNTFVYLILVYSSRVYLPLGLHN